LKSAGRTRLPGVSVLRLFPLYPPALKTILLLFIAAVLALAFLS
jgi:hypothetical protein